MRGLIAVLAWLPAIAGAQIYKCTDAQGRVNMTDKPCGASSAKVEKIDNVPIQGLDKVMRDARAGSANADQRIKQFDMRMAQRASARSSHQGLSIGMTDSDVMALDNWGYPDDKNVTQTPSGTSEQWVYSTDPDNEYENMYLYFVTAP
ncbi:MAG: DUF4124 domain-containing protein [Pseudomonadaceae bacterium]|nr:DUF4124 domain-containing protein [Pseudomonadaceae bacterium]